MSPKNLFKYPQDLKRSLFQTLLKRIPPKSFSPHLEDIVNALMDALSKGELELNLNSNPPDKELKNPGWPKMHQEALLKSGWLEGEHAPMILEDNQLSWRRWHDEMNEVIKNLINRSQIKLTVQQSKTSQDLTRLPTMLNREQQLAVEVVSNQRVVMLSGGPGTGKTSTVMQMLEQALSLNNNLKIGLAAPTGKAARRLQETLHRGIESLTPLHQEVLYEIPCYTLHKWLQSNPQGFAKNKQNPLNLDLLVIDEMSMVDLRLMKALIDALPKSTQLFLVGDSNQLPPIGSGSIWHKLQRDNVRSRFGKGAVHLHKRYRNRGALALASNTLCEHGLYSFWEELSNLTKESNIQTHHCKINRIPPFLLSRLQIHSKRLKHLTKLLLKQLPKEFQVSFDENIDLGKEGEKLLRGIEELMVLCPKRHGRWGVDEVHKALLGSNIAEDLSNWPQGTPVMCKENQPEFQLANGDIGLLIGEKENRRLLFRVFSEEHKLTTRFFHPARLKAIEPAFAMTVHKAQGSEADEVILLWPDEKSQSLPTNQETCQSKSYEERLLYTAITRARKKIDLITKSNN
ncbi:exodeoxyribonuclease V subunit alpha [Prochlorococcus sp. MIT 1307]|uniref:exodeoxyribonuclease V subunit alpha n=1 Tax=Prochlorococcus sp. MIT 1307 TaxID=3096219 RepID=UPI002A761E95|nr:exodeoxyribonuclease V subunit alpha [Prochlorococcus sp. MIT 1307]